MNVIEKQYESSLNKVHCTYMENLKKYIISLIHYKTLALSNNKLLFFMVFYLFKKKYCLTFLFVANNRYLFTMNVHLL